MDGLRDLDGGIRHRGYVCSEIALLRPEITSPKVIAEGVYNGGPAQVKQAPKVSAEREISNCRDAGVLCHPATPTARAVLPSSILTPPTLTITVCKALLIFTEKMAASEGYPLLCLENPLLGNWSPMTP